MVSQLFKLFLSLNPESWVKIRVAGEISDSWRFFLMNLQEISVCGSEAHQLAVTVSHLRPCYSQ